MENSTICPHCQVTLQAEPEVGNWEEPSISEMAMKWSLQAPRLTLAPVFYIFNRGSVHSANVGFLWPNVMAANTGI